MLELPVHPIITDRILYIVGSTGSGKTTLVRGLAEIFDGKVAMVTETPGDHKNIPTFHNVREAIEYLEKFPPREKKMLIIDDIGDFDLHKISSSITFVVITAQEYKENMKEHPIIFLRPKGDELDSLPLKKNQRKLLDRAAPGFGILRTKDGEISIYFYV